MGAKRKAIAVALTATFVVGGGIAAAPVHASSSDEAQFVSKINQERASRGIPTLAVKGDLISVARRHSDRMAADGTIYHNENLAHEVGGGWSALGENVGMGPTVETLHNAFMASPGHRSNILDRDFNQIGVGVTVRDDTIYVTEVFAGRFVHRRTVVRISRAAPRPSRPAPPPPGFRTISILLNLLALDAEKVDPKTGLALGV